MTLLGDRVTVTLRPEEFFTRLYDGRLKMLLAISVAFAISSCSSSTSTRKDASPKIAEVLAVADDLTGTPYCYAGTTPDCFDCSGFVYHCFSQVGINLPRTSKELFTVGTKVDEDNLAPGDLVFFNTNGKSISHVGIYMDDGKFIHSSTSSGVILTSLGDRYWAPRYVGARRVVAMP